jgi:alkylhydroperoxidase family enzyme
LPEPAQRYVDKVHRHAYRVVDADVEVLRDAGWSEEAIFELTIAAALGAGLRRLELP